MGWSGGTFTLEDDQGNSGSSIPTDWAGDGDAAIKTTDFVELLDDIQTGINSCLNKDGSNAATGDLDLGTSYHLTNLAAGTATGDSGRWDEDVAGVSLAGTVLTLTLNSGSTLTQDIASVGTSGEVTLTTTQTLSGQKTFTTNPTTFAEIKGNGPTSHVVSSLTAGANVAVDTTAYSRFWLNNTQAMTLTFTFPSGTDAELGANYCTSGVVLMRNGTGHGAITLATNAAVTDSETVGARPTGSGDIYSLVYECWVIGSSRYVQWTWVSP